MFLTKKALDRRTVLRGMGAALALPLLDAMVPAGVALAQTSARPLRRQSQARPRERSLARTKRAAKAAGVIPGTRPAAPSVAGRARSSRSTISRERPGVVAKGKSSPSTT